MLLKGIAEIKEVIMGAVEAQGIEIHKGDVVIFYPSWLDILKEETRDAARYYSAEPRLRIRSAQYLTTSVLLRLAAILGDFSLFHSKKASAFLKLPTPNNLARCLHSGEYGDRKPCAG